MEETTVELEELLLPEVADVAITSVDVEAAGVRVTARSTAAGARCPVCDGWSDQMHGCYPRQLHPPSGASHHRCGRSPAGSPATRTASPTTRPQRLKAILARCPQLEKTADHVRIFAELMSQRRGDRLDEWIGKVEADDLPDLHSFVTGLRQDYEAVVNGLTLPYSSGAVEGHNNRTKMLKRQMFGRAKLPLLRKRILLS